MIDPKPQAQHATPLLYRQDLSSFQGRFFQGSTVILNFSTPSFPKLV